MNNININIDERLVKLPQLPKGTEWVYRGAVNKLDHPPETKTLIHSHYFDGVWHYWEAVAVSKTPRTDKVFADIGENILDHARELETELDAAKGIAEALEEEVRQLKEQLANSQKLAAARNEAFNNARHERDNWEESAAQYHRNQEYYRDLLVQCGQAIGKKAYISDDGTTQADVLVAKVPELVRRLKQERNNWEHLAVENAELVQVCFDECSAKPPHTPQEDFAQQAKELLRNLHGYPGDVVYPTVDNFVDLIIKAAKQ